MHVFWWWYSLQTMVAERPEAGQARVTASVEQRGLESLFVGGFSAVEQHNSGQ